MPKKINALKINQKDNVATALEPMVPGDIALILYEKEVQAEVACQSDVPMGHKIAAQTIPQGDRVIKYGESIGMATVDIPMGSHVHVHNVKNLRARGNE